MADTGYNWDANWTVIDAAIALTQGGTIQDISAEIDLDGKAACLISFDTDYSDHARATAGLDIRIRRDVDDTVYESDKGAAMLFEMPFTQNSTERKVIFLSAQQFQKFVIQQDWGNTTGSSVATTATAIKYATIPAAS
jgi:hypothetical protein